MRRFKRRVQAEITKRDGRRVANRMNRLDRMQQRTLGEVVMYSVQTRMELLEAMQHD